MSINTLIQNALHGSCATGCGCALCIPSTINQLESPQLMIDSKLGVLNATIDVNETKIANALLNAVLPQ